MHKVSLGTDRSEFLFLTEMLLSFINGPDACVKYNKVRWITNDYMLLQRAWVCLALRWIKNLTTIFEFTVTEEIEYAINKTDKA